MTLKDEYPLCSYNEASPSGFFQRGSVKSFSVHKFKVRLDYKRNYFKINKQEILVNFPGTGGDGAHLYSQHLGVEADRSL